MISCAYQLCTTTRFIKALSFFLQKISIFYIKEILLLQSIYHLHWGYYHFVENNIIHRCEKLICLLPFYFYFLNISKDKIYYADKRLFDDITSIEDDGDINNKFWCKIGNQTNKYVDIAIFRRKKTSHWFISHFCLLFL